MKQSTKKKPEEDFISSVVRHADARESKSEIVCIDKSIMNNTRRQWRAIVAIIFTSFRVLISIEDL